MQALKGIDLKIPRGSIFGLLGPNGAGKSTFINILAGLTRKTAGKVTIWGRDIDERPRDARAAIGVVPQEIAADVFFTPRESLEVQAGLYGVPKARAAHRRAAGRAGPGRQGRRLCAPALRRHEAPADGGQGHGAQSAGADPGRAHRRGGRGAAPPALGLCGRAEPTGRDHRADHPLSGGGRRSSATPSPSSTAARWWRASPPTSCCGGWTPAPWWSRRGEPLERRPRSGAVRSQAAGQRRPGGELQDRRGPASRRCWPPCAPPACRSRTCAPRTRTWRTCSWPSPTPRRTPWPWRYRAAVGAGAAFALKSAPRHETPQWGGSIALVAQLDRALPSEGRGHRFESCRVRQERPPRATTRRIDLG